MEVLRARSPLLNQMECVMKLSSLLLGLPLLTFGVVASAAGGTAAFSVESPDLNNGRFEPHYVANGFGCSGANVSPEIRWHNAPAGTKSFALVMHDPDAPTGIGGFTHWVVVNIPASASGLARGAGNGSLPAPAVGVANGFDNTGVTGANGNYGGPCPPERDRAHRYVFTLYALAVDDVYAASGIPRNASTQVHGFVLSRGIGKGLLGQASFTALYGR
jgi:Raf kinase inhibitor-like YbhB/YbcL family protein